MHHSKSSPIQHMKKIYLPTLAAPMTEELMRPRFFGGAITELKYAIPAKYKAAERDKHKSDEDWETISWKTIRAINDGSSH